MKKIYVIYWKGEPIHEVDFFIADSEGKIRTKKIKKRIYTKLGYAKNAVANLPSYIKREHINIVEYEKTENYLGVEK